MHSASLYRGIPFIRGMICHSFLAPGCGGCALTFAGINLLVYLDFPSLICLNEINGHSCVQIYPELELSLLGIPANRAHPKRDSTNSNNRLNNTILRNMEHKSL